MQASPAAIDTANMIATNLARMARLYATPVSPEAGGETRRQRQSFDAHALRWWRRLRRLECRVSKALNADRTRLEQQRDPMPWTVGGAS